MATFIWSPSYASTGSRQYRVQSTKFGDGYVQRLSTGLNRDKLTFSLKFAKETDVTARAIDAFLRSHAGATAFEWSPPAPHDYGSATPWQDATAYPVIGTHVSVVLETVSYVYTSIAVVGASDPGPLETGGEAFWVFGCRLPLRFISSDPSWSYDTYNAVSMEVKFEQVFDL